MITVSGVDLCCCACHDLGLQYFIIMQLISILLIAPWLSTTHAYDNVFDAQPKQVNKPWYVFSYQVINAVNLIACQVCRIVSVYGSFAGFMFNKGAISLQSSDGVIHWRRDEFGRRVSFTPIGVNLHIEKIPVGWFLFSKHTS